MAEVAQDTGALTVGVVTKPFLFEGRKRSKNAERGVQELIDSVDSIITAVGLVKHIEVRVAAVVVSVAWLMLRLVDVASEVMERRLAGRADTTAMTIIPVGRRIAADNDAAYHGHGPVVIRRQGPR